MKKLKLADVPDGRILRPGRQTREQIPAICGKCYEKGGKQVWVKAWRYCIDERRTARAIERIYVIEKCKCPDCGAWLGPWKERERIVLGKISPDEKRGGKIIEEQ